MTACGLQRLALLAALLPLVSRGGDPDASLLDRLRAAIRDSDSGTALRGSSDGSLLLAPGGASLFGPAGLEGPLSGSDIGYEPGDAEADAAAGMAGMSFAPSSLDDVDFETSSPELHEQEAKAVQHGTQVLIGMIDAFLHRKNASKKELECLNANLGDVAYTGYTKSANAAAVYQGLYGRSVASVGMQLPKLAFYLNGLLKLPAQAITECTSPAAVQVFMLAAEHLSNLTYVAGHVTANGADILNELADAVAALRDNSYPLFGQHLGKAGRKALLVGNTSLPEGKPTEEQIVNVSAGLIQGFFGEGFEIDITSEQKVSTFPLQKMMKYFQKKMHTTNTSETQPSMEPVEQQRDNSLNIHIDLHSCVHKNLDFFQSALFGAWYVFAQSTANLMQVTKVPVLLSSVMHELPEALAKCGVSEDQVRMLEDSVLSLQRVHVNVETPDVEAGYNETIEELHKAAGHWDELSWFEFGEDLGGLLLEFVLDGFPQLYSVGPTGRLLKLPSPGSPRQGAVGTLARATIAGLVALLTTSLAMRWRVSGAAAWTPGPAGVALAPGERGAAE